MDIKAVLLQLIFRLVGTAYRWGGDDAIGGFDCSGLVIELLQSVGVLPPGFDATAQGLRQRFPPVSAAQAKFGDLVFFGTATGGATHVGMYLGSGLMLEAGGGDSTTTSLAAAVQQNALVRVRPVSRRTDRLGYARPSYQEGAA